MYKEITKCRICGNKNLVTILNLGKQSLTGVFPFTEEEILVSPVELVVCHGESGCGLVQIKHTVNLELMYGNNYGYRSGLNQSMVRHLHGIVQDIINTPGLYLNSNDYIVDIASNDGTLLKAYGSEYNLVGVDPTIQKFGEHYPPEVKKIADFFPNDALRKYLNGNKVKIFTSIACVYDLEDPQEFFNEVSNLIHEDGVWIFEQSYLPSMINQNAWDTVVSEHLEYYSLSVINKLLINAGLYIHSVKLTDTNGGSFIITAKKNNTYSLLNFQEQSEIEELIKKERTDLDYFREFQAQVAGSAASIKTLLTTLKMENKLVIGLGASTKGNCLLQYAGITNDLIPYIAEINSYKFGRVTPGTKIPIIPEKYATELKPDYYFVLPWHFKKGIIKNFSNFLEDGGKLIFPLPKLEIIGK